MIRKMKNLKFTIYNLKFEIFSPSLLVTHYSSLLSLFAIRYLLFTICYLLLTTCCFAQENFVALTFDDGPHPYYTRKILEILDRFNVKATFFLVGTQIEKYPYLVKEIFEKGHEIGNHTYSHKRLIFLTDEQIKEQILKNDLLIEKITGKKPLYFRPPGGRYYFKSLKNLTRHEVVLWTINTDDIKKSASQIFKDVIQARDGDIILMHSGVPQTVKVLPRILRFFKRNNIRAVSVSQLKKIQSERFFSTSD